MYMQKSVIIIFMMLLLATAVSIGCGGNGMSLKDAKDSFSELVADANLNDMNLTIYYMRPGIDTHAPLSADNLVYGILAINDPPRKKDDANGVYEYKIVVEGNRLAEHLDLLRQLNDAILVPVDHASRLNARIYYMFATKKAGKLFDVAMWSHNNGQSIFVNGAEVKEDAVFYNVIIPFLPEGAVKGHV